MQIHSFRTPGLGDQTYLLEHEGAAILVDPQRDIDRFLATVEQRDLQLRWVLDTHLHNDYVSGGEAAAKATGAEHVMPAGAAQAYWATPAFHLEDLPSHAGLTVRPIHTPGHTPEHTSYLVLVDGEEVAVFSGGSLLVGSAGRPDLLGPERADTLARLQYLSIHRLAGLPRELGLFPTHGAGSFCSSTGGAQLTSTIGDEVDTNPMLAFDSPEALSESVLGDPMPIPAFYRFMTPTNTYGVKPMPQEDVPLLSVTDLATRDDIRVIDIRPREDQASGTLEGSVGIELADDFGSWAGWLLPYDESVALVANQDQDVAEALTQLRQIQFDNVVGITTDLGGADLTGGFELVDLDRASTLVDEGVQVLDVRMPSELDEVRLSDAVERFLADLFTLGIPEELDRDEPVLAVCASGRRASIAASRLTAQGYDVRVLSGDGMAELVAARNKES